MVSLLSLTETPKLDVLLRENFVCVEPGVVRNFIKVNPGESWVGQQVITLV